jgi:hypothetical protein
MATNNANHKRPASDTSDLPVAKRTDMKKAPLPSTPDKLPSGFVTLHDEDDIEISADKL